MSEANQEDVIPHGEEIVERFGGIRPMASKLNVPVTTVQGWKKRDAIPAIRRDEILSAAATYDINLKGVMSESANQNARGPASSQIPEDPALSVTRINPQATAPRQPRHEIPHVDLHHVRKTARRTSLITTSAVLVIVLGAGYLLFGGGNEARHISSLEARMSAVEDQTRNTPGLPAVIGQMVTALQGEVQNIASVLGVSGDSLSQMAKNVSNGSGVSLTQRLALIEQQLGAGASSGTNGVVDRLQTLSQTPQGRAEWQSALEDLRSLVTGLQGRTDQLDTALIDAKTQNDALGRTLSDVSGRDLGAAAMLLTLGQLRESTDRQTPFADDLSLLRDVAAGTDPDLVASIDKLAPYAATGVLSPAGLKQSLLASANDIVTAKLRGEDVSFKDKIMARLQALFSIRKDGVAVAGGEERTLIEQASAQLDRGDVAGAQATLQKLQGPAATAIQPWQKQADATQAAQALDTQLVSTIVSKIKTSLNPQSPINMVPSVPVTAAPPVQESAPAPAPAPAPAETDSQNDMPSSSSDDQSNVIIQQ